MQKIGSKLKQINWHLIIDLVLPSFLILASVGVAFFYVSIASQRILSQLENIMFQIFILAMSLIGSFGFGKRIARKAAKEFIKPHARSAFRRLIFLYQSLSRLRVAIEQGKKKETSVANTNMVLDKLEAIVIEQIATANDALEDWRDIVPEDVEELISKVDEARKNNE